MGRQTSKQEALEAVGAYIIATCERRLELKGRKWDEIRDATSGRGLTPVPAKDGRLRPAEGSHGITVPRGDHTEGWALSHGAGSPLADLLYHCCLPLRFEASNSTLFHRGIASPGAKYPIDVRLLVPKLGGESRWLKLDSYAACLLNTVPCHTQEDRDDEVRILLSGDLAKLLDPYGDMSANLVTLEAGMTALQMVLFAQSLGMSAQIDLIGDATLARDQIGVADEDLWPLLAVRLSDVPAEIANGLRSGKFRPTMHRESKLAGSQFPLLESYQQACETEAARSEDFELARTKSTTSSSYSSEELRQLCLNRSSGAFSGDGRPEEFWTETEIGDLMREISRSECGGPSEDLAGFTTVHFSFRGPAKEICSYHWRPANGTFAQCATFELEKDALEAMRASLVVTFGVDDAALLSKLGPRGHMAANAVVGMLVQRVTLAVTASGRNARAIGAYDGAKANLLFEFDRRAYLQLKAARSTLPNPSYGLI